MTSPHQFVVARIGHPALLTSSLRPHSFHPFGQQLNSQQIGAAQQQRIQRFPATAVGYHPDQYQMYRNPNNVQLTYSPVRYLSTSRQRNTPRRILSAMPEWNHELAIRKQSTDRSPSPRVKLWVVRVSPLPKWRQEYSERIDIASPIKQAASAKELEICHQYGLHFPESNPKPLQQIRNTVNIKHRCVTSLNSKNDIPESNPKPHHDFGCCTPPTKRAPTSKATANSSRHFPPNIDAIMTESIVENW